MTLDDRKANILRAVVEEYIETAQPVGSGRVAKAPGVKVSSATVRNDMAVLEQEGYLAQPHTSAGRIPTEKGYRFFVDQLDVPGDLAGADAQQVRSFFAKAHGELEQILQDTSRLLARLTRYAAVVVGPPHEAATIRSVQLVGLTPRVALLVLVLSNGVIEKHTLEFDHDVEEVTLNAAGARLARRLVGETLASAATSAARDRAGRPGPEGDTAGVSTPGPSAAAPDGADPGGSRRTADDDAIVAILGRAFAALAPEEHKDEQVFIGGAAGMASAFDAVAQVSEILQILEQQYVVVSLLHDVVNRGLQVAIGTETGMEPLADCAVIVSPYTVDGEPAGTIGVLGPTRMHYSQALAAVAVVSQRLGNRLSEG